MNASRTARPLYEVSHLAPDQVMAVYPLIRHHHGHIEPQAWQEFALPLVDGLPADLRPSNGIIVATRRGAARGLFVYVCLPHLDRGRVLLVPHVFCVELLRTLPLWALLLGEMNRIARDLRCAGIHLVVQTSPGDDLAAALQALPTDHVPIDLLALGSGQ